MTFGQQIKKKRKDDKLSAEQLANLLGVKMHNIFKWENGTKPSDPEDYIKISNWLSGKMESFPKSEEKREPSPMELLAGLTKGFEAIAETMRSIESKMAQESTQAEIRKAVERIEANLPALLDRQEGGFGIVIELLKRDALREAGGNQEKADEILGEIVNRIGPKLSPGLKESIAAHDGM